MHNYLVASSHFAAQFIKHVILSYVVVLYSIIWYYFLNILICCRGTVAQYYFVLLFIHLEEVQDRNYDRSLG